VIDGTTVREVLDGAIARYGDEFDAVLRTSRVWVNGESADDATVVGESDEVAVLPPVSGGH
jgi:molybdopterin converting factor small subunit